MQHGTMDWLEVVYGAGFDLTRGRDAGARAEVRVRAAPGLEDLAPGEVRRIRVTVNPTDPRLWWQLFLRDINGTDERRRTRVWWRAYPGTWQPLDSARECVAEGRGRVRVDVSARVEQWESEADPQLRFVAEVA